MVDVILILLLFFLFFFCLFICKKNQNMSMKIKELQLKLEIKENAENVASVKFLSSNKVPINEISKDIEDAINECEKRKNRKTNKTLNIEEDRIDKILDEEKEIHDYDDIFARGNHVYEKNILSTFSNTTSPVNISNNKSIKQEIKEGKEEVVMNEEVNKVNLNDFIRRDTSYINITPEDVKKDIKTENISFVEEISRKLEEQLGPQTIELTDYEKEQEETAIISYKELLKVKEQLYESNEIKENDEFIQDLKAFRDNLT